MIITEKSKGFKLSLFAILYFVQGIISAFTTTFAKPYLDSFGVDPDLIGLMTSILLLPFILKVFYGMISDRINLFGMGHRLPYIWVSLIISALALLAAGFIRPDLNFWGFAGMIILASFAISLYDTTTDALAVDITPVEEQGLVQSVMTSGRAVGIVIMAVAIGWIAQLFGWLPVYIIMSISLLIPMVWIFQIREPAKGSAQESFDWSAFQALIKPSYLIFALYSIIVWFAYQGADGLVTFYMSKELGATESQLGYYGSIRGAGMIGGAFLTTFLIGKIGRRATTFLILGLVTTGAFIFSRAGSVGFLLGFAAIWGGIAGLTWTIHTVLSMTRADPRIAGSMFAISMAFANIGWALGDGVSTSLTDNIGFSNVFLMLSGINLLALPVIWFMFKMAPQHELALEEGDPTTVTAA
ncbi:MAG: MFS transporter [Chloroflexota bacterium]